PSSTLHVPPRTARVICRARQHATGARSRDAVAGEARTSTFVERSMPTSQRRSPLVRRLVCALALFAPACAGSGANKKTSDDGAPKQPIGDLVEATNKPEPIGQFLASLDAAMRHWNELQLTGTTHADREKARKLELWLATEAHQRRAEIVEQLE